MLPQPQISVGVLFAGLVPEISVMTRLQLRAHVKFAFEKDKSVNKLMQQLHGIEAPPMDVFKVNAALLPHVDLLTAGFLGMI